MRNGYRAANARAGTFVNGALETSFFPLFHTASTLSGSLRSPPSPRGEGFVSGIAVCSYRSLPHWGRGTAPAVDRVLSLMAYLRRSSPLFFIPLSPSNLRPFGAPPSMERRVCPRKPLPLEGAAERSEAGLASFFAAKPPPFCLPHRGRGTASAVDRVLSQTAHLRRSSNKCGKAASSLPSPLGKGDRASGG